MSEIQQKKEKIWVSSVTSEQSKDTGLALLLIFLLLGYFTGITTYYKIGMVVLVLVMIYPGLFNPLAKVWYSFSNLLGSIMSKIILTLTYFLIVIPIATIRKLAKIDNLKLNEFHKGTESVMIKREHVFNKSDIENPY
jgi:hypothetical protein